MFRPLNAERVYYLLSATQSLAFAIMYTVYTVYFVQTVKLDPLQLVLVGTVLEAAYFLFEIPTGVVADLYSRRLSIILGVCFLGAGGVLAGAAPLFGAILLAQVISAIGYTFLSGATTAWLADEVGEANVGAILLRSGQISRLTGLAGIALSAVFASLALNLPFIVGGGLLGLLGIGLSLIMPEHGFRPKPRGERTTWQSMWHGFRDGARVMGATPILLILLGVEFFMGASSEGLDRLGDAHLLQNFTFPAIGNLQPIVWFSILGVIGTLVSLVIVEPLRKRLEAMSRNPASTARGLLVFDALAAVCLLIFALTGDFWLAVITLMVRSVAFAAGEPLFQVWLVQHTRPEVRATMLSMVGQANALGQMAGGPGVGLLGNVFGLRVALAAAAVLLLPALPFYVRAANEQTAVEEGTLSPLKDR
jgi:DHA3 family tetracycline resistance protein-like MFS transporter